MAQSDEYYGLMADKRRKAREEDTAAREATSKPPAARKPIPPHGGLPPIEMSDDEAAQFGDKIATNSLNYADIAGGWGQTPPMLGALFPGDQPRTTFPANTQSAEVAKANRRLYGTETPPPYDQRRAQHIKIARDTLKKLNEGYGSQRSAWANQTPYEYPRNDRNARYPRGELYPDRHPGTQTFLGPGEQAAWEEVTRERKK